jgi:serine/threonine protein kinase
MLKIILQKLHKSVVFRTELFRIGQHSKYHCEPDLFNIRMKKQEQIGPYTLIRRLGTGASRRVWLAHAGSGGEKVALKLAREGDEEARLCIMHEVDLAASFDHPNIVRMFECGASRGITWIAMGYAAGPHDALTLANFRQLLLALVHVHANNIIHADIKHSNLLLDESGDLKLSNFGLARRSGQGAAPGSGTPQYMAPEQLRGQPLDLRADIFSAGVVLYQILTGTRPFEGTALEVMQQVIDDSQPAPSAVAPGLGTSFDEVIRRALARDRGDRYATAFEFLAAFDAACRRGVRPAAA